MQSRIHKISTERAIIMDYDTLFDDKLLVNAEAFDADIKRL